MAIRKVFTFLFCCSLVVSCGKKASDVVNTSTNETIVQDTVVLNEENFPDENFRAMVCYLFDAKEGDSILSDRFAEVEQLRMRDFGLNNLKGIEYFVSLKKLQCIDNFLTEIDLSKNIALEYLECGKNQLTSINLTHNPKLVGLGCSCNQLTNIDVSKNPELQILLCDENMLETIDVSNNPQLRELAVNECKLKELDVSKNLKLEQLLCNKNQFKELDLSKNTSLNYVFCEQPYMEHVNITYPAGKSDIGKETNRMLSNFLSLSWNSPLYDIKLIRQKVGLSCDTAVAPHEVQ